MPARPSRMGLRGKAIGTVLLGVVLGFGGTTAATMVKASERGAVADFFDTLFGVQKPTPAPVETARKTPRRYASLPDARRIAVTRIQQSPRIQARLPRPRTGRLAVSAAGASTGARTVCVRLCDGYLFPLGRLGKPADLPVHEAACAAACPGTRTDLFTLPSGRTELEQSVSLDGQPYLAAAWANVYRRRRVESCACQPAQAAGPLAAIGSDRTMRAGDVVATEDSAEVVTRIGRQGPILADYREAPIGARQRRDIEERVGTLRREADAAAFRKSLRLVENRAARVRVAEAQVVRLRLDGAAPGFGIAEAQEAGAGFVSVRVVAPSPFER